ncbi:MAG: hypothetical protein II980_01210 [Clostridia bacterium]|nr:hypothetical protein [Clostridia bacterium]
MTEDKVKQYIEAYYKNQGYNVTVAYGHTKGIDILAVKNTDTVVIEAKGIGAHTQARTNYFLSVLGEILQRMESDDFTYYIAFPDHPKYRRLWETLPKVAKTNTKLGMILVNENGDLVFLY